MSILETSKILMHQFWYDYIKPNYQNNTKLCYVHTDSFVIYIKTEDVYEGIADDLEEKFDISYYEVNRPFPTRKNKQVTGLMKDELGGKFMTQLAALIPKIYSYLMDDDSNEQESV